MSKFFCTLSVFVLIVAVVIASATIQVPCPMFLSPITGRMPLIFAICFVVLAVYLIFWLWVLAEKVCGALREWMGRA